MLLIAGDWCGASVSTVNMRPRWQTGHSRNEFPVSSSCRSWYSWGGSRDAVGGGMPSNWRQRANFCVDTLIARACDCPDGERVLINFVEKFVKKAGTRAA